MPSIDRIVDRLPRANRSLKSIPVIDPYLSFLWQIRHLPDANGIRAPDDSRIIRCNVNFRQFEAVPVYNAASKNYFPGTYDTQGPSITVVEDDKLSAHAWVLAWQSLVCDEHGFYGVPTDFKKDLVFEAFDNKGIVNAAYQANGAWPSAITPLQLDRTQSEKVVVEITFQCDSCFPVAI